MSNEDVTAVPVASRPAPAAASPPSGLGVATTLAEMLAEKRRNADKREQARQVERDTAELHCLELEERFEKELNGRKGQKFMIIDASDLGEGHVVVKLGEDVQWTSFIKSKQTVVDVDMFVTPLVVHPSADDYRKLVKRRAFVADRCASALATLYGVKADAEAGK